MNEGPDSRDVNTEGKGRQGGGEDLFPCPEPQAPIAGKRGAKVVLRNCFLEGRKQLPIVELKTIA